MKQLLIVKTTPAYAYNVSSGNDLKALANGAIGFFNLSDGSKITGAPTENFCIALGRGANSPAFVIPEVDVNSLSVVKASYSTGAAYSGTITIPTIITPPSLLDYHTIIFITMYLLIILIKKVRINPYLIFYYL